MSALIRVDPEPLQVELDGRRFYNVEGLGLVPSVTTVLRGTAPRAWGLERWRADLGPDVADMVTEAARARGRALHRKIEHYLTTGEPPQGERADGWWQGIAAFVANLARIGEVVLTEGAVWHPLDRYAGTVDHVVRILGSLHVFDWKTAVDVPNAARLVDYEDQVAAYADAIAADYAERPTEGAVVIAFPDRPGRPMVHRVDLELATARWRDRRRAFGFDALDASA